VILLFQNLIFFDQKLLPNPNILHRPWLTPFKSEGGQAKVKGGKTYNTVGDGKMASTIL
jgi:hypothetical protein